jgi:hypothetical protein
MLYGLMQSAGVTGPISITMNDINGVARTPLLSTTVYNYLATQEAAGGGVYGIIAGTGSTANAAGTHGLATPIANGTGSGQISYGSMGITQPSGSAPLSMTFTRTLTNNSGGTITITELMLACLYYNQYFAITRDVFAGLAVLNGNNITFTVTIGYTIA